jgi:hypothetical protein
MGRPLKIKKSTNIDIGFNAFDQLTNPVLPTGGAINSDEFVGVVGGNFTTSIPTVTYPVIKCQVNIALPDGSGAGDHAGRIIRQKGAHKYLVADGTTLQDEDLVVGAAYQILALDTTNWQQMGAPAGAVAGTIFTCTAVCADPQNGTALLVGQCVLTSDLTPTAGNMSISYFYGANDSTETAISKLTNKFLQNFAGGATGGNSNENDVWAATDTIDNVAFVANFFSDEGTMAKSGAEADTWGANGSEQNSGGTLDLAIVEKYSS